jgi:putative ABC transport system substrate-binding protein
MASTIVGVRCNFDCHNGDDSQDCEPVGSPSGRLRLPDPIVPQAGLSAFLCAPARATKWLELLKEIAPQVKWIAYIFSPKASPYAHLHYAAIGAAAGNFSLQTGMSPVNEPTDVEPIVARLGAGSGMIFNPDAFMTNNLRLAIDLTARYRLPAIYGTAGAADAGGLIGYSLDLLAQYRETMPYLDRILKDANPGDLPVQQPTKFQFAINLKTAMALGLTIPPSILARADEVIE